MYSASANYLTVIEKSKTINISKRKKSETLSNNPPSHTKQTDYTLKQRTKIDSIPFFYS